MKEEPTTDLVARYRSGDGAAADELFRRYVERLTALARMRLSPKIATRTDPEDVVLSAYRSFFVGLGKGQFSIERSGDLWRLLASITVHKVSGQLRRHRADRRDVAREESQPENELSVYRRAPTPEEAVALADELGAFLETLQPLPRRILELRLQDESVDVIASLVSRSERTVRRVLADLQASLSRRLFGESVRE